MEVYSKAAADTVATGMLAALAACFALAGVIEYTIGFSILVLTAWVVSTALLVGFLVPHWVASWMERSLDDILASE